MYQLMAQIGIINVLVMYMQPKKLSPIDMKKKENDREVGSVIALYRVRTHENELSKFTSAKFH